jgi:hypothetical protein
MGMKRLMADAEHHVLESGDIQLVIHAIPAQFADAISIAVPPVLREQQAVKPFFTVDSLSGAERLAAQLGGRLFGPVWAGPGFSMRNACDPEGNIIQIRENVP